MKPLPDGYKPYPELRLCSNKLLGSSIPILVNDFPVFLIGIGAAPLVWLAAPTGPDTWKYIVEASRSLLPTIRVDIDLLAFSIKVFIGPELVLAARNETSEIAEVNKLDLRPLGLVVHGDSKGLFVGTNSFVNNTFKGLGAAFAIGDGPPSSPESTDARPAV